jgi:hypothetical protein
MQTGTRRRRSDSPTDSSDSAQGASKRPRGTPPLRQGHSPPNPPSSSQSHRGTTSSNMSGPSNGHPIGDPPIAGPSSSNGHTQAARVKLEGLLMYADDKAWTAKDDGLVDAQNGGIAGSSSLKGTQRMPVNREEITRLMVQAMRDIGYQ